MTNDQPNNDVVNWENLNKLVTAYKIFKIKTMTIILK